MIGARPPKIILSNLRPEDHEKAAHIDLLLDCLQGYVEDFNAALTLCEHIEAIIAIPLDKTVEMKKWRELKARRHVQYNWSDIPIRDSAFSIYHFCVTIDAIVKGAYNCKSLLALIDQANLNRIQPLFEKHFPLAITMRNSVGHISDWLRTPESLTRHAHKGPYDQDGLHIVSPGINLISHRSGRKLMIANCGRAASVELSREWLEHLVEVQRTAYQAFKPAAKPD
jgi:hypothetical protein